MILEPRNRATLWPIRLSLPAALYRAPTWSLAPPKAVCIAAVDAASPLPPLLLLRRQWDSPGLPFCLPARPSA